MAVIAATRIPTTADDDIRVWTWTMTDADTAAPVVTAGFPDVTLDIVSKSASCTVNLTGTCVPTGINGLATPVYHILDDPGGTAITVATTVVGAFTAQQACYAVAPSITAGTATAVLYLLATRSRR